MEKLSIKLELFFQSTVLIYVVKKLRAKLLSALFFITILRLFFIFITPTFVYTQFTLFWVFFYPLFTKYLSLSLVFCKIVIT
ncbi:hypothetical protein VPAL9027_00870 [Vibrio palustris]|uniref:Uncharacterized protein n=1 Tax=Vibrio palustris TaxID=1918946 RepID=A0A1R4B1Y3_9VIBR|nr:hypothetical protein VPAL9027_00870 [Vibrio palustris]